MTTKATACIERGVPTVAAAESDLASAMTFLVSDLCAREVTARETYKRSAARLQMMKQQPMAYSVDEDEGAPSLQTPVQKAAMKKAADQRKRMYQNARVDSETGELKGLESTFPFSGGWSVIGASVEAPANLRALAAERLLAARSSRTGR